MAITAPYNFAPLAESVLRPSGGEWDEQADLQDIPLASGICGTLRLTLRSDTPILCAEENEGSKLKSPFMLPNGHYALPGSSLRGMIRNVLEIASFSRMNFVDDQRFGVRDLQASARAFYGNHLTHIERGQRNHYRAKSKSGWLRFEHGNWFLHPCNHGRVDHSELKKHLGNDWIIPNKRPNAENKYQVWLEKYKTLTVSADIPEAEFHQHNNKHLHYSKITSLKSGGDQLLIMTGQPGPGKHMEFVFSPPSEKSIELDESVSRGFLDIYKETDHWKYLCRQQKQFQHGIPVFYLTDNHGSVASLGLSQMYKLAYQNTVGDVIERTQGLNDYKQPDMASRIFGQVSETDSDRGSENLNRKGRVSFSHASGPQSNDVQLPQIVKTILNGPKPTYFPNYIEQNHADGKLIPEKVKGRDVYTYATLMDNAPRLRGWKRYPVRPENLVKTQELTPDQAKNEKIQVKLQPLPAGTEFNCKVRLHNLLPVELGAILWTIKWGGDRNLRHNIGMGKPFGFGVIDISVDNTDLITNNGQEAPSESQLIDEFTKYMQHHIPGWSTTPTMQQLLAMANPSNAPGLPGALKHMDLANKDFVNAKKNNLVLLPYTEIKEAGSTAAFSTDTPGGEWLEQKLSELEKEHHTKPDKLMLGKPLANAWSAIDDPALKEQVLEIIRVYWQNIDRWDDPVGRAQKQAHKIYTGQD